MVKALPLVIHKKEKLIFDRGSSERTWKSFVPDLIVALTMPLEN
jgi:hypothetical protein